MDINNQDCIRKRKNGAYLRRGSFRRSHVHSCNAQVHRNGILDEISWSGKERIEHSSSFNMWQFVCACSRCYSSSHDNHASCLMPHASCRAWIWGPPRLPKSWSGLSLLYIDGSRLFSWFTVEWRQIWAYNSFYWQFSLLSRGFSPENSSGSLNY